MPNILSKRVQVLSESLTLAVTAKANEMKAMGENVISLSAGEPDFDTPDIIKKAAISAIENGCGHYTAVCGIKELLEAVARKLKRDNELDYDISEIITNVGAKHSLFECIQSLVDVGDEVIIPNPCWVSYPEMVKFSGAKSVFIEGAEENGFKITPKELKSALNSRSKILILNSPNNPIGAIYTKDEFTALAKLLEGTKVIVLSDEMYEKINYSGTKFASFAAVSEDALNRTVTINGLSKCGAMPGWRFGYLASKNKDLIAAVKRLQGQSTNNICSIVQHAAIPALLGETDSDIAFMCEEFKRRRDRAIALINEIAGLSVYKPDGAFYLFVNCAKIEKDSVKFCKKLLETEKVALVPGLGFGKDGYFRLSYATSLENIEEGLKRLKRFVESYKA